MYRKYQRSVWPASDYLGGKGRNWCTFSQNRSRMEFFFPRPFNPCPSCVRFEPSPNTSTYLRLDYYHNTAGFFHKTRSEPNSCRTHAIEPIPQFGELFALDNDSPLQNHSLLPSKTTANDFKQQRWESLVRFNAING